MKMRWLCAVVLGILSASMVASAAEPPKPDGLSDEEWQLVRQHRQAKAEAESTVRVSPNPTAARASVSSLAEVRRLQSITDLESSFTAKAVTSNPFSIDRDRFVLIYRNNTLDYVFGEDPTSGSELRSDLYLGNLADQNQKRRFSKFLAAVRLRDSLDGIKAAYPVLDSRPGVGANAAENKQAQEEDNPATLGWTRDGVADSEVWQGKGVFYLPFAYFGDDRTPLASGLKIFGYRNNFNVFYPAVRYDRDSSKDGTEAEVNTLDFLMGVDMNFINVKEGEPTATSLWLQDSLGNLAGVVRLAAGVRTNFDFEDATFLTELNYMPVDKENRLNAFITRRKVKGDQDGVSSALPAILHKIILKGFGNVSQSGFVADAPPDGLVTTLPLGFEAGFALRPGDIASNGLWRRLELSATYRGQWDILNNSEFHGLLEVALSLPFIEDQTSYAGWKLSYKKGDDLTNYDELDQLSIGLEVKF